MFFQISDSPSQAPDTCQYVQQPAISNDDCDSAYYFFPSLTTDSMICAGYPGVGGKGSCKGDSGGPLVCNNAGKAVLAGVVSFGLPNCEGPFPRIFARVTHVLDWIKSHMVNYEKGKNNKLSIL